MEAMLVAQTDTQPQPGDLVERELTLVFTDIEGSTALTQRLGDEAWVELLLLHNEIVRDRVWRHGGREVKFSGDGFMLAFDEPVCAARCAISIQRVLGDAGERYSGVELPVRIGIHHGRVLCDGHEIHGAGVKLAEQVMSVAHGGEILVTPGFPALVSREALHFGDPRALNGIAGTHSAYPLRWRRPLTLA